MENMRKINPIHSYEAKDEEGKLWTGFCEIPFNSTNKYNLLIRDCNDLSEKKSE